jgi:hypothetical protein
VGSAKGGGARAQEEASMRAWSDGGSEEEEAGEWIRPCGRERMGAMHPTWVGRPVYSITVFEFKPYRVTYHIYTGPHCKI